MLVYVAFAAIVIFQSDIRRALAHFGRAPFFRYFNRRAADETIEEVVVAATMLARSGLARSSRSSARSGCATTSRAASRSTPTMTYDLLVTIFQPESPLHDGAVVHPGRTAWPRRPAFCR